MKDSLDFGEHYDRQGKPISMLEWAVAVQDTEGRRIGYDQIGQVRVSTVWLGMNHRWGDGPPLIFETMIFGGPFNEDQWRYSTEEEARAGHAAAVQMVKDSQPAKQSE